jgi:hypothetical protein
MTPRRQQSPAGAAGEAAEGGAAWSTWAALWAAATAVLARLPFAARRLWDHDSVQFALGVERYDLAAHHPHPPGYPLYIGILKLLAALGVDPLHGMVALSILAAGLGAALIVPLTARLALRGAASGAGPSGGSTALGAAERERRGKLAGLFAAALYIWNPLLWFYGELPLVYAVEGGMTVALAYAALRMGDGRGWFLAGCAAFALAGGIRPSTLVLLLPLFLLGVWRAWRRGLGAGGLAAGAGLALALGCRGCCRSSPPPAGWPPTSGSAGSTSARSCPTPPCSTARAGRRSPTT